MEARSKLRAKLDRPKVDQRPESMFLSVVSDASCPGNMRVLMEVTESQFFKDWEAAVSIKNINRFLKKANFFADVHNRNLVEKRKLKKIKLATDKALELAQKTAIDVTGRDSRHLTNHPAPQGPPAKIIGGSKRSIWGGKERSAVRAWDSSDRSWTRGR